MSKPSSSGSEDIVVNQVATIFEDVCLCAVRGRVIESGALASPPRKPRCESLATITCISTTRQQSSTNVAPTLQLSTRAPHNRACPFTGSLWRPAVILRRDLTYFTGG
jgi:hypothetical protein